MADGGTPGDLDTERDRLLWTYDQLLRVEQHWTDQIQNQQRRVGAVLAVNGFLLAFLAAVGFQLNVPAPYPRYLFPLSICLGLLTVALVFGVVSLFPLIKNAGQADTTTPRGWWRATFVPKAPRFEGKDLWLDAQTIKARAGCSPDGFDAFLADLCRSVAGNANGNLDHAVTVNRRRTLLHWQITFIVLSLLALILAVAEWADHVLATH